MSTPADPTAGERDWVRRVLADPRFRVGPDLRREELVDVIAGRLARESAAATTRARAEALAPIVALADQWNDTPDYTPTDYDQGCVDQRHAMTMQLLEVLPAPDTAGESA